MSTAEPQSKEELLDALNHLQGDGLEFWATLPGARFVAPFGEAWSPADNLRHLIKSTTPVSRALCLPAATLESMFGTASQPSATFMALRDRYRSLLEGGVDAGQYAPSPVDPAPDAAAWQGEVVSQCREALAELVRAVARWDEGDLDTFRLPHPLLGPLTLREMLMFTVYHYAHHRENVARRMAALAGPPN